MNFDTWWEKYGNEKGIISSSDDYTSAKDAWAYQKAKLQVAVEALEFYGNEDNWIETPNRNNLYQIIKNDVSDDQDQGLRFGGKLSREALFKIKHDTENVNAST